MTNKITSSRGFAFPFLALTLMIMLFLVVATKADDEIVKDSDGKNLKSGGTYTLSVVASDGSHDTRISIASIKRSASSRQCWASVIQYNGKGLPITIKNGLLKSNLVSTEFPVSVSFDDDDIHSACTNTTEWVVVYNIHSLVVDNHKPVMMGDNEPEEFRGYAIKGYFYVKPYDAKQHHYKFQFCHPDRDGENCSNIGVLIDKNNHNWKRLVWTSDKPLVFKFDAVH